MKRQLLKRTRRGNALVEFALSFGVLFALFSGTYQFGYAFFIYNRIESAVRSAARYASLRTYDSTTSTPSAEYITAVKNSVVYGNPDGGATPVAPGLSPSHVDVSMTFEDGVPRIVSVQIQNYSLDALFKTFNLNGKPVAVFPFIGRFDEN